jgi:predicted metal-dependent peptidase
MTDPIKVLSRAKTQLMLHHPFFGSLAMSLPFVEDTSIDTMCTDGKQIRYSPDFVLAHTPEQITGVVAHEVMHVTNRHPLREGNRDHRLWNIATDYAINPIIVEAGLELPDGGLLDPQFKGMSAEKIYTLLQSGEGEIPEGDGWSFGEIEAPSNDDGSAMSDSEMDQLETEINVKVLSAHANAKMRGKVPAGIEDLIDEMSTPQVDWRDKLRVFVGGDQPDDFTWAKPNKKFMPHDIYLPTVEHFGAGDIVIGCDTSASVSDDDLKVFLGEINGMAQDMQPRSITVIGCDAKVQSVDYYGQGEDVQSINSKGRGGTEVTPVFDYIEQHGLPCDSFIYFSDMYVYDFPKTAPDYPVLWVSTGATDAPWGEVVKASL